jgi:hypothetical protein
MDHWAYTAEVKDAARTVRRTEDKLAAHEQAEHAELKTVVLFRPLGERELDLIRESGYRRFPPRLPEQPIFYPVCNERYAREIAERWNARDGAKGFVTRFRVHDTTAAKYQAQIVGARHHQELWVPAEELEAFNDAIVGQIEVIAEYPSQENE